MDLDGPTPEQEKETLKQEIERILDGSALPSSLSANPGKRSALQKTLNGQNYSWRGLALYIDSLSPQDQYYLLKEGFYGEQRKTIWPYLSEETDLAWEYNGHPPVDLDDDVRAWPPEQQANVLARSEEHTSELQSLRHLVC